MAGIILIGCVGGMLALSLWLLVKEGRRDDD
jgi:hypothetical protein